MNETEKQTIDLYVSIVEHPKSIPQSDLLAICPECKNPSLLYRVPSCEISICQRQECKMVGEWCWYSDRVSPTPIRLMR